MKTYYVKGGILVNTPFFRNWEVTAGAGDIDSSGIETLPTNRKLDSGEAYLLIDDKNPQSIFANFIAASFFTTGYMWAPLFSRQYSDDFFEFSERLNEARQLMAVGGTESGKEIQAMISRNAVSVIFTAYDTFIADIILTRIITDEDAFYYFAAKYSRWGSVKNNIIKNNNAEAEQKLIEEILSTSFCSTHNNVEAIIQDLFGFEIKITKKIKDLFKKRHLLVHRGGRRMDGSYLSYDQEDFEYVFKTVYDFVSKIVEKIKEWESKRPEGSTSDTGVLLGPQ